MKRMAQKPGSDCCKNKNNEIMNPPPLHLNSSILVKDSLEGGDGGEAGKWSPTTLDPQDTPHLLHRHKQQVVARAELSLLCDRAHHQTQSYVPSSQAPWNTSHHIHGQASHNTRNTPRRRCLLLFVPHQVQGHA